ncbi:carbohydrate ABC transporter permease [Microvirga lotononidis]|uniref:ABC-type sugar transport system, permease component n=1 Tax=Microvirga lotononidis TaxID=864069 RepID=I4Z1E5_9HYPH|nr:carbohydrate ABC transporter permease [Microvirga lotononidis]EIM30037.1 ABC-type sugar transport system, permease component [Microvirga lotononidis]WQO31917.1 carbohydrate ABC transporter permease [Microvirga lotononidis]
MTASVASFPDVAVRTPRFAVGSYGFYIAISVAALIWSSPLFILFFTALKSANDFAQNGTFSLPQTLELSNFAKAWDIGIKTYFMNSLVLTLIKVPTGVFICSLAAFALTKMRLRGAQVIFTVFVLGLVVPMQMTLVPLTTLYQHLGLIDSLPGLFFLYLGFGLPLGILILRGYFRSIPDEMIEAAFIDGCSWWDVYWRIVMPVSKPAIVSLLILDGISTWNEFILAQIFIRTQANRTLPLGVVQFSTEFSTAYELLAAGQIITIAPLILLYLFFQRYFVHGMAGAIK